MYGMVNQAIRDMVINSFGEDQWIELCKRAGSEHHDFVSMQYYPDDVTYKLVGAASQMLNTPAENILREFGKYWVLYTAKEGYGPLMDLFGADFKACLANLNHLHSRMGMTMPHLTPPKFEFKVVDEKTYAVEYLSKRGGLSPMVQGLLEGLATKYGVAAKIEKQIDKQRPEANVFVIQLLG